MVDVKVGGGLVAVWRSGVPVAVVAGGWLETTEGFWLVQAAKMVTSRDREKAAIFVFIKLIGSRVSIDVVSGGRNRFRSCRSSRQMCILKAG